MPIQLPQLPLLVVGASYPLTISQDSEGEPVDFQITPVTVILDPPAESTQSRITLQHIPVDRSQDAGAYVRFVLLPATTHTMDPGWWTVYYGVGPIGGEILAYGPYQINVTLPIEGSFPWAS